MARLERLKLDDAELLASAIVIEDPRSLEGLSQEPPPLEGAFQLLGEYHLGNDDDGLACSYCPTHTKHWKGFAIETSSARYLLGSTCGPKHFNLTFGASLATLKDQRKRQSYLRSLHLIANGSDSLVSACNTILQSGSLRDLESARKALNDAAPDLMIRLRASRYALHENVKVRDLAAEANSDRVGDAMIFRVERISLGALEGVALIDDTDPRVAIYNLMDAMRGLTAYLGNDTNLIKTTKLRAELVRIESLYERATEVLEQGGKAFRFFTKNNRLRLVRWSRDFHAEQFQEESGALWVHSQTGRYKLPTVGNLSFAALPPLQQKSRAA